MRRWAAALVLLAASVAPAVRPTPASACSCAPLEPRDALLRADGAVIGTIVDIREGGPEWFGAPSSVYTIDVEEALKGDLGDEIDVLGGTGGASCGLEAGEGARVALLLTVRDGSWSSSLCAMSTPRALRGAAQPLPEPDGRGRIAFVAGGDFGEARLVAVDAAGRTLAYGWGEGEAYDVDMCPGGERLVEGVRQGNVGTVVVRDTSTLEVRRRVPLLRAKFPSVYHVGCLDAAGRSLVAVEGGGNEIRVFAVEGGEADEVYTAPGRGWLASVAGGVPYVEPRGQELLAVNTATGDATPVLADVRLPGTPAVSPDGRFVVAHRNGDPEAASRLEVWSTGPIGRAGILDLDRRYRHGRLTWADDHTFVFDSIAGRVFAVDAPSMRVIAEVRGWWASDPVIARGWLVGVEGGGEEANLLRARLDGGKPERVSILAGQAFALASVPGGIVAEPGPPPPPPDLGAGAAASSTIPGPTTVPWLWIAFGGAAVALGVVLLRRRASAHATR